ncbi:rhodanese-like domain-containing protein [Jeotgalibacillus campisalis]|uniref:Molybdopterin biosynthesis MoeB protein n=1 Tax=Jeotgalibacillus campisalis TaxID=220754 RepID=A0A0C2SAG4_9BACL|nr:rhodanese-like domain-containing protein [Jeotgalibacillus campisalis]KIL50944.1 molybdopterin biosynthesis MoeB protein [Jeotgalibacillus campisalis]
MKQITPADVEQKLSAKEELQLIDVRETDEVAQGKIPGAQNIPLGLLEFRMHELDKKKEYTLVCRSGGRSGMAAELLDRNGYHVINMTGGMLKWNGPTE